MGVRGPDLVSTPDLASTLSSALAVPPWAVVVELAEAPLAECAISSGEVGR